MGGGGSTPSPQPVVDVPSAADEEAAAERARLYSLLRSRRGASGLQYGARPRVSLLGSKSKQPAAQTAGVIADLWSPFAPKGEGSMGEGDSEGGPTGGNSAGSPSDATGDGGRW
jgi:hypothetical protein